MASAASSWTPCSPANPKWLPRLHENVFVIVGFDGSGEDICTSPFPTREKHGGEVANFVYALLFAVHLK